MVFNPWKNDDKHELYKLVSAIGKSLYDMPFKSEDDWRMCMAKMWVEHIKLMRRVNSLTAIKNGECYCDDCISEIHSDFCYYIGEGFPECHDDNCYNDFLEKEEIDQSYFTKCISKHE